jgi:hypothetical protein
MTVPVHQAHALSVMYTQLLGRDITFTPAPKAVSSNAPSLYATYLCGAVGFPLVVQADLALMASVGGVMVGLPHDIAYERVRQVPMDELLRDAIHEVLNITSTPLSMGYRVVFQTLHLTRPELSESAQDLLNAGLPPVSFTVAIRGYAGGLFQVTKPH